MRQILKGLAPWKTNIFWAVFFELIFYPAKEQCLGCLYVGEIFVIQI